MTKESKFGIAESNLIFKETFNDESSVRENSGIPTNVIFKNGSAEFNGNSSINYSSKIVGSNFSIRIRFTTGDDVSSLQYLEFLGDTSTGQARAIRLYGSHLSVVGWGNSSNDFNSIFPVTANTTYEAIVTWEGNLISVYKNGEVSTSATKSLTAIENFNLVVGKRLGDDDYFKGEIELFEIYNEVLSAEQAKNLYDGKFYKEIKGTDEILKLDVRAGMIENKYSGDAFGDNIIVNGDMENWTGDLPDGWSKETGIETEKTGIGQSDTSKVKGNYAVKVHRPVSVGSDEFFQNFTVESGKEYRITFWYKNQGLGQSVRTFIAYNVPNHSLNSSEWTMYSFDTGKMNGTTLQLSFYIPPNTTLYLDSVSVREKVPMLSNSSVSPVKKGDIYVMDFNGNNSKLDLGRYNNLIDDISISLWFKARTWGSSGNKPRIMENSKFVIYLENNGQVRVSSNATGDNADTSSNSITLGEWYHLAITRDSTGIAKIYINTILKNSSDLVSGTPQLPNMDLLIGTNASNSLTFDGQISNIRVIEGILSQEEISQIYTSERKYYG